MSSAVAATSSIPAAPQASSGISAGDLGLADFSFHDLVSIVNPLQHIPIVSTLYRTLTGDTIRPLERIAGDSIYGGFWGFVSSVANVAYQEVTGKDFGETALAFLTGDDGESQMAVAANNAPSATSASPSVTTASSTTNAVSAKTSIAVADTFAANGPPRSLLSGSIAAAQSSDSATTNALMSSLNAKGFDSQLSARALAAYRRSLEVPASETIASY